MKKKQNILLVEDDATLSDAFSLLLTKEGFNIIPAFNGKEALEKAKDNSIDLILLDLLMPVMDGREFLETYENKDSIPIIVFSNLDAKNDVDEIINLGVTRYMLKAWASPKELTKIIQDTIKLDM
jgi:DNA-binding response OmpR family regulator